ncbi:adenosine-specific kinase [bacterium]|nr:adenosine-specific kinase [bacterium]
MNLSTVKLDFPEGCNIILGMSHFIKTVEDLHEVMVNTVPGVKFGLAFCEASQDRLIRHTGTDEEMRTCAVENAQKIAAGHSFIIVMKDCFPINFLNEIKSCREVCRIFCATANPVEAIIAETELGRGIIGVVDGLTPLGVEDENHIQVRKDFLRKIGYKF